MGTLYDYINWRGDLSFQDVPLNEVDSLIFSLLSYLDLKGIVSEDHNGPTVSLRAAANAFFARNPDPKKISLGLIVPKDIVKLFRALKDTVRFRNVGLKAQVNRIDTVEQTQFSAITFLLDDRKAVVTYRGTDDTLIGWKENFNMSFMPVIPAQNSAVDYLEQAAQAFAGELYLTGHSKGGNLAVFAGVRCHEKVKPRISQIWCNDGPGFGTGMLNDPDYIKMRPVIHSLVPQSSVVGMLLEHDEHYTVVKSRQTGLFQHDGLSWNVMGGSFIHLENVTEECKRTDKTLNEWIKKMTPEQREQFVDALYQVLSTNDAMTLTDLLAAKKNKKLQKQTITDPQVHQTIQKTLTVLLELNAKNLLNDIFKKKSE